MARGENDPSDGRVSGRCLCGSISYTAAAPVVSAACHCRTCQRQTGTAFSTVSAVPATSLVISGQPACYATRGDSGGSVRRHFCAACGSPLFSIVEVTPDLVWLKSGTLDGVAPAPGAHIWWADAVPWLEGAVQADACFETNPPQS